MDNEADTLAMEVKQVWAEVFHSGTIVEVENTDPIMIRVDDFTISESEQSVEKKSIKGKIEMTKGWATDVTVCTYDHDTGWGSETIELGFHPHFVDALVQIVGLYAERKAKDSFGCKQLKKESDDA